MSLPMVAGESSGLVPFGEAGDGNAAMEGCARRGLATTVGAALRAPPTVLLLQEPIVMAVISVGFGCAAVAAEEPRPGLDADEGLTMHNVSTLVPVGAGLGLRLWLDACITSLVWWRWRTERRRAGIEVPIPAKRNRRVPFSLFGVAAEEDFFDVTEILPFILCELACPSASTPSS